MHNMNDLIVNFTLCFDVENTQNLSQKYYGENNIREIRTPSAEFTRK